MEATGTLVFKGQVEAAESALSSVKAWWGCVCVAVLPYSEHLRFPFLTGSRCGVAKDVRLKLENGVVAQEKEGVIRCFGQSK